MHICTFKLQLLACLNNELGCYLWSVPLDFANNQTQTKTDSMYNASSWLCHKLLQMQWVHSQPIIPIILNCDKWQACQWATRGGMWLMSFSERMAVTWVVLLHTLILTEAWPGNTSSLYHMEDRFGKSSRPNVSTLMCSSVENLYHNTGVWVWNLNWQLQF